MRTKKPQIVQKLLRPIHASWCFYAGVWGVIAGIILNVISNQAYVSAWYWLILAIFVLIFSLRYACILMTMLAIIAGFLIGNYRSSYQFIGQEIIAQYVDRTVTIAGTLSEDPDDSKGSLVVRLQNLRLLVSNKPYDTISQNDASLQVIINSEHFTSIAGTLYVTISDHAELERSDLIMVSGKLGGSFGTFVGNIYRAQLLAYERQVPGDIFAQFKHWFAKRVREFIPSPEADLGLGYLMGMKSALSEDFSTALQLVGMTHVVVASGAHLAILTDAAKKIFGKISRFAGLLFSLLMIMAFVMVVGLTPSMARASLVAALSLLMGYVGREFTPLRLISFVAMLTLLINPMHFLNLGWQLSFASFFGILVLAPRLTQTFYGGKTPPWLASMLITSISTTLVCAPVMIYSFGTLSLLSLVANLIILPTLPYAMLLIMLVGGFSFLPTLATLIAYPAVWLLDLHIWLVNFLSEKSMFILSFPTENPLIYLIYLPIIAYLVWPACRKLHNKPNHN